MRTYSRETFIASQEAWDSGEFGVPWMRYRELAAARGFIYPPLGSKWDSWEDDEPSQRAIIYRAIEDTPDSLKRIIGQSRSWFEVVRKLMADLNNRREDADLNERQIEWDRQDELTPPQALQALASIFDRIQGSKP